MVRTGRAPSAATAPVVAAFLHISPYCSLNAVRILPTDRGIAAIPAVILLIVGCVQIGLTRTTDLSPWKGGGFGMFSTTDDGGRREVRAFVTAPERSEELALPASLEDLARRAAVQPGDRQLVRLARGIVERERRHGRPVETVRLECWRVTYAPGTLAATTVLARAFTYRADPAAAH